jgi:hypothetical protein
MLSFDHAGDYLFEVLDNVIVDEQQLARSRSVVALGFGRSVSIDGCTLQFVFVSAW